MLPFAVANSGLFPEVQAYLATLVASLKQTPAAHSAASARLATWIAEHYQAGAELPLIVVCTGNSRRSVLLSTLLNLSAAYCGLPEIRGYSGGTHPSAVNSRTIAALRAIGVEVWPLGTEAARGEEGLPNPRYQFYWGRQLFGGALESLEFSKTYHDASNPQTGFGALMVCDEADAACPVVTGAAIRVSLPFVDPKARDGFADEAEAYAACRDDIGRLALATLMEVRRMLDTSL
ncbi:MAG: hypothetical protein JWN70_6405 [Planctomycetaceae bacterium]|nr:hypothetical protein [Planctomycetaceae bacterium]